MTLARAVTYNCTVCGAVWSYEAVRHVACCRDCGSGLLRTSPTLDLGGAPDEGAADGARTNPVLPMSAGRCPLCRFDMACAAAVAVFLEGSASNREGRVRRISHGQTEPFVGSIPAASRPPRYLLAAEQGREQTAPELRRSVRERSNRSGSRKRAAASKCSRVAGGLPVSARRCTTAPPTRPPGIEPATSRSGGPRKPFPAAAVCL